MEKTEWIAGLCLVGVLASGTVSGKINLPGDWQQPSGGYQVVFDADDGVLPGDNSGENKPRFINSGYGTTPPLVAPSAEMTKDEETGEKVLCLVTSPTAGPLYRLLRGAGRGSTNDLITLDMRLRFPENVARNFQFIVSIWRPAGAAQQAKGVTEVQYVLRFSNANFTKLKNDWHDLRFHIDVAEGKVKLYLDGSMRPVQTQGITINENSNTRNQLEFGDGGGTSGIGSVNIAYIAWTNVELAPVVRAE